MLRNIAILLVILFTISLVLAPAAMAQEANQPEILVAPAEFAYYFNPPGASEKILRPSAIYFDRYFGETFVADQGHNRVMIFDREGRFKYEFSGGKYLSSPIDLAVDSEGYIWILGANAGGWRIFKFDFDGLYIEEFEIPGKYEDADVSVRSFDISADGDLYLYDQTNARILVMDATGEIQSAFEVLTGLEKQTRIEQVVGKLRISGDHIVLVSGTIGSVYIYDLDGNLERLVGRSGGELGQMTFPAAAVMTENGTVIILDKMSHNFVIFDSLGQPVAEIGGRGQSPGWFYQPSLLEIDDRGRIFIGQILDSRVQACNLPHLPVFDQPRLLNQSVLDDRAGVFSKLNSSCTPFSILKSETAPQMQRYIWMPNTLNTFIGGITDNHTSDARTRLGATRTKHLSELLRRTHPGCNSIPWCKNTFLRGNSDA